MVLKQLEDGFLNIIANRDHDAQKQALNQLKHKLDKVYWCQIQILNNVEYVPEFRR